MNSILNFLFLLFLYWKCLILNLLNIFFNNYYSFYYMFLLLLSLRLRLSLFNNFSFLVNYLMSNFNSLRLNIFCLNYFLFGCGLKWRNDLIFIFLFRDNISFFLLDRGFKFCNNFHLLCYFVLQDFTLRLFFDLYSNLSVVFQFDWLLYLLCGWLTSQWLLRHRLAFQNIYLFFNFLLINFVWYFYLFRMLN